MSVRILVGDMRQRLKELPDNSVDSCVCDPPYHLTNVAYDFRKTGSGNNRQPKQIRSRGIAADVEQFDFIGCELSVDYAEIARRRIEAQAGMFAQIQVVHSASARAA